jgi:ankyrin repeat protein
LHFASYRKNHDIIRLILERFDVGIKVEVNAKTLDIGNTALHIAVQNRDTKSIELLFDKRWLSYVFINIQNNDFKPPLWLAAEQNYTEICKLLIFKGSATEIIQGTLTDKSIRNNKHLSKSSKVINYTTNKNTEKVISKSMEKMVNSIITIFFIIIIIMIYINRVEIISFIVIIFLQILFRMINVITQILNRYLKKIH